MNDRLRQAGLLCTCIGWSVIIPADLSVIWVTLRSQVEPLSSRYPPQFSPVPLAILSAAALVASSSLTELRRASQRETESETPMTAGGQPALASLTHSGVSPGWLCPRRPTWKSRSPHLGRWQSGPPFQSAAGACRKTVGRDVSAPEINSYG